MTSIDTLTIKSSSSTILPQKKSSTVLYSTTSETTAENISTGISKTLFTLSSLPSSPITYVSTSNSITVSLSQTLSKYVTPSMKSTSTSTFFEISTSV